MGAGGIMENKPNNPYRKGSLIWSLMDGDFSDLTVAQIAEVFDATVMSIRDAIWKIRHDTGYDIPRTDGRAAKWRECL